MADAADSKSVDGNIMRVRVSPSAEIKDSALLGDINGAELHEIATLAGHKNIRTTISYTHTDKNRLTTVVNNTFSELG